MRRNMHTTLSCIMLMRLVDTNEGRRNSCADKGEVKEEDMLKFHILFKVLLIIMCVGTISNYFRISVCYTLCIEHLQYSKLNGI